MNLNIYTIPVTREDKENGVVCSFEVELGDIVLRGINMSVSNGKLVFSNPPSNRSHSGRDKFFVVQSLAASVESKMLCGFFKSAHLTEILFVLCQLNAPELVVGQIPPNRVAEALDMLDRITPVRGYLEGALNV
jgi:hypothetical protein